MREEKKILYRGGTGEITEKKSRFIADLQPVKTEEEAMAFVDEIKKRYWDAKHHCYAWITGQHGEHVRCSDDGEPSQTAGRPILDVLKGEGLHDVCAVVTRYFGGTLLGTGGLVRAYSGAVSKGLLECSILLIRPAQKLDIMIPYHDTGKIQYLLGQREITTLTGAYTDCVTFSVLVPDECFPSLIKELTELTGGRAGLAPGDQVYYGRQGKEVLLFP